MRVSVQSNPLLGEACMESEGRIQFRKVLLRRLFLTVQSISGEFTGKGSALVS